MVCSFIIHSFSLSLVRAAVAFAVSQNAQLQSIIQFSAVYDFETNLAAFKQMLPKRGAYKVL